MISKSAQTQCDFKDKVGDRQKDLKFEEVRELFQNHVTVTLFIDTSKWHLRGDYDPTEMKGVLDKYRTTSRCSKIMHLLRISRMMMTNLFCAL